MAVASGGAAAPAKTQVITTPKDQEIDDDAHSLNFGADISSSPKLQEEEKQKAKSVKKGGTASKVSLNDKSIKSLPVTEGSNFSIPEDTGMKKKEEIAGVDEEYSIEDAEEYSDDGEFEADSPLKKTKEQEHAATNTELKSPHALH